MKFMEAKELIVVGGPNGAGKTTLAEEYVSKRGWPYLSADAIASRLSPGNPTSARVAAGRKFLRDVSDALVGGESFVVESTLSGRTFRNTFRHAGACGFVITTIYLFVDSVDLCVDRVHARVSKGGHDVPDADIRRRFTRSLRNFWHVYRPLSNEWLLLYNAGDRPLDVARGESTGVTIGDAGLFARFQRSVEIG